MKEVRLGGGLYLHSNEVKVKVKRLTENADIPSYSRSGDAGLDLTATSVKSGDFYEYGTGIAVKIPEGYVGLVFPRSSLSKYDLMLCNHVAVIDSNYTGEIKLRFKETVNLSDKPDYMSERYKVGDRIGQLIVQKIPEVVFEEVSELEETERGSNGFGSSGV